VGEPVIYKTLFDFPFLFYSLNSFKVHTHTLTLNQFHFRISVPLNLRYCIQRN